MKKKKKKSLRLNIANTAETRKHSPCPETFHTDSPLFFPLYPSLSPFLSRFFFSILSFLSIEGDRSATMLLRIVVESIRTIATPVPSCPFIYFPFVSFRYTFPSLFLSPSAVLFVPVALFHLIPSNCAFAAFRYVTHELTLSATFAPYNEMRLRLRCARKSVRTIVYRLNRETV